MSEEQNSRARGNEAHSDEFVAGVVGDFDIPQGRTNDLRSMLKKAARIYLISQRAPTWTEQLLSIRRALEHVERSYLELSETLASLPHPARDRLWHPLFADPNRPPNFQGLGEPFGQVDYADEKAFSEVLAAFGKRVRMRLADVPDVKRRGGRPKLAALRNWVGVIADFWANELGRKFTYAEYDGNPKSEAYELCWRLLQPIDSNVSPQQLITAMRSVVKPRRAVVRVHPSLLPSQELSGS